MEPRPQRRSALFKDRSGHWIDMIAAMVTGECCTARHTVVLAFYSALGAHRSAIRPALIEDVIQASIIVRELCIEVLERVFLIAGDALSLLATVSHNKDSMPFVLLVVKGYLPLQNMGGRRAKRIDIGNVQAKLTC
jgi:hypothetical protein